MSISAFLFERFAGLLFDRHTDPNDHYRNVCYRKNILKKIERHHMMRGIGGCGISEIQDSEIGGKIRLNETLSPGETRCHPLSPVVTLDPSKTS